MRAAIYARRSTEEHQAESLDTQIDGARRFAAARGWTIEPEHVFLDSGVSRAEFKNRRGLLALVNAAERKPRPFDVVIVRDETRLGGDMHRTGLVIQGLFDVGCRLFYYATDEEVRGHDANARFLIAVRSFAAELEREKTSSRTRENHARKFRAGLNVGGRCFGYDNVEVLEGDHRRVEYRVNDAQAAIVREVFTRYAAGAGLRTIAKELNARGVPAARSSWATSGLHAMLRNERYRGVNVWGRVAKTYRGGTKVRVACEPSEQVRIDVPHLRIVPEELWAAAHARMPKVDTSARKKGGRPPRYLLSSILRCGACGGPLKVINGKASFTPIKVYVCANYHTGKPVAFPAYDPSTRGVGHRTRCTNSLRRPVETVDAAVLAWVARTIREELLVETLEEVRLRIAKATATDGAELPKLEREAAKLRREVDRLVDALAVAESKPEALVRGIAEREERARALDARIRAMKTAPEVIDMEVRRLQAEARRRLGALHETMRAKPDDAHKLLGMLFPEGITADPVETEAGKRYRLDGFATLGPMLAFDDEGAGVTNWASPAGFEPA